ncbi:hypothetical protein PENTCL1PPCAC_789, partial [Pristionchus entomophagus]
MKDAAKSTTTRPSKRDVIVIDDEESTEDQPVSKNVKREEEPEAAPTVAELQEEVAKLKDSFQRACRAARLAELRAEQAESFLDSKQGVNDGAEKEKIEELEKNLDDALKKLEAATKREEKAYHSNRELLRQKEVLNAEVDDLKKAVGEGIASDDTLKKALTLVSWQLNEARTGAESTVTKTVELARENEVLKIELNDAKRRADITASLNAALSRKNESLKTEVADLKTGEQERMAEISTKLDEAIRNAGVMSSMNATLSRVKGLLETELAETKKTQRDKMSEISSQLEVARRGAGITASLNAALSRANESLKIDLAETKRAQRDKVLSLMLERDAEKQKVREGQARIDELTQKLAEFERSSVADHAKIDELKRELVQYEGVPKPLLQLILSQPTQSQLQLLTPLTPPF